MKTSSGTGILPASMAAIGTKSIEESVNGARGGAKPQAACGRVRRGVESLASLLGIALAAGALSLYFFTPRFVLWYGLNVEPAQHSPEVARAVDVMAQLADPFVKTQNLTNIVIRWRLLFPLIGHFLHLPPKLFLAIPQIGCLITLMYVAHVSKRFVLESKQIFFITAWTATASWFFVSTGWLTYNDSWAALGLLLLSFSRSRTGLIGACLLVPWIDERFVLMTPLAVAVRCVAMEAEASGRLRTDVKIIVALLVPYLFLRLVVLSQDYGSLSYLTNRGSELRQRISWSQYILGPWMGLRLLWIAVGAGIGLTFRARRALAGTFLLLTVLMCLLLTLVIAADLSRTMSSALPAALLGVFLLIRDYPQTMSWGLPLLLGGNLFLPAWHVVTVFNEPIFYCYAALNEFTHPPPEVNAEYYLEEAEMLARSGQQEEAKKTLGYAWQLDPAAVTKFAEAMTGKAGDQKVESFAPKTQMNESGR